MKIRTFLLAAAVIGGLNVPVNAAEVLSTPVSNTEAYADLSVELDPDQATFAAASASVTIDPNLLKQGQTITLNMRVTNKNRAVPMTFKPEGTASLIQNKPAWLTVVAGPSSTTVSPGGNTIVGWTLTVGEIPSDSSPATMKLRVTGTKAFTTPSSTVTAQ